MGPLGGVPRLKTSGTTDHMFPNGLPSARAGVDWEGHLEALPFATWIGDPKRGSLFVNRAYRELLGVSDIRQVSETKWAIFVHPDDRENYVKSWNTFVQGEAKRFRAQLRWVRPDNSQVVKIAVRAQKLESGQFQGWVRLADMESSLSRLERLSNGHR